MTDKHRGHEMVRKNGVWCYADTGKATARPHDGKFLGRTLNHAESERPCGECGIKRTREGHDGCLGTLPNVRNACCGHGDVRDAYVQLNDGSWLGKQDAIEFFEFEKQMQKDEQLAQREKD